MHWEVKGANGLFISILLNEMRWYFGVIGKIRNYEFIIYISTGKIQNGTPSIFIKSIYHCW